MGEKWRFGRSGEEGEVQPGWLMVPHTGMGRVLPCGRVVIAAGALGFPTGKVIGSSFCRSRGCAL